MGTNLIRERLIGSRPVFVILFSLGREQPVQAGVCLRKRVMPSNKGNSEGMTSTLDFNEALAE